MLHKLPPFAPSFSVPTTSLLCRKIGAGSKRPARHFSSKARRMDPTTDAAIGALKAHGLDSSPPLAIVLGSGLGAFADEARDAIAISYLDIPGFPIPTVEGHAGRLVVGAIEGRRVALFQGRGHYYERGDPGAMRPAIDAFRELGGEALLLTNA